MSNIDQILVCDCNSTEHQIVIYWDEEDKCAYCKIHLTNYSFWKRLKYLFGYKCKFGAWDEFILSEKHIPQLKQLLEKLQNRKNEILPKL